MTAMIFFRRHPCYNRSANAREPPPNCIAWAGPASKKRRVPLSEGDSWMYRIGLALALSLGLSIPVASEDAANERLANRPKVPGKLRLRMQKREETPPGSG